MTDAPTASRASTRPEPTRSGPYAGPVPLSPANTSCVAVFMTAALICCGVHVGCVCATSAAMPATCGEDIEVPEYVTRSSPVPEAAELMSVPGAATSGLTTP